MSYAERLKSPRRSRDKFFYFLLDTHLSLAYHSNMSTITAEIDRIVQIECKGRSKTAAGLGAE